MEYLLLGALILAGLLAWRGGVALRVQRDARRRGVSLTWAMIAFVDASRYWWGARLDALTRREARSLLEAEARVLGVRQVSNVPCPLCAAEIEAALALNGDGALAVRPESRCPRCDFRLDACRHCLHFQPAGDPYSGFNRADDFTHGRCGFYRAHQPVREAYPHLAGRLEAMGYETLTAPRPIVDSYIPLDECTAFTLSPKRWQRGHLPRLDRRRLALIRLQQELASTQAGT
jgi:hypothetical protein